MKKLLERGANPSMKGPLYDDTALYWAVNFFGGPEAVLLLLQDPRVNVNDCFGCMKKTVLHSAVENNKYDYVQMLIRHGADLSVRDRDGKTPIDIAKTPEMKKFIQSVQAEIKKEEAKVVQLMFGHKKRKLDIFYSIQKSLGHSSEEYA